MKRRLVLLSCLVCALSASAKDRRHVEEGPHHKGGDKEAAHTVTWWCTDLSELLDVEVPIATPYWMLATPDPSPVAPCAPTSSWPVSVPVGGRWAAGGGAFWFTNTSYNAPVRAGLAAMGYRYASHKPIEDFIAKVKTLTYVVVDLATEVEVARFNFNASQVAVVVSQGDIYGAWGADPWSNPAVGIDYTAAQVALLPSAYFMGVVKGKLPPGLYRVQIHFIMTDVHNDGLGLDPGNFIGPGDMLLAEPPLLVTP
jgi:hypothetical protein